MVALSNLEADRGDTNIYDLDANISIDHIHDKIWFTLKRRRSDPDAEAVLTKQLDDGILITDAQQGKFQVQLQPDDLKVLEDLALIYDVQIYDDSQGGYFTVRTGVMVLTGEITEGT